MLGKNFCDFGGVDVLCVLNKCLVVRWCPLRVKLAAVLRGHQVVRVSEGDLFLPFFGHAVIVTAVDLCEPGGRNEGAVNRCRSSASR